MGTILMSIVKNLAEVLVFVVIAWAGILGGKKLKMNKTAQTEAQNNK